MKEIKEAIYHDDNYDIDIRMYLTNAEIQSIANSARQFSTWGERKQNIDALLLHFCTNIGDDKVEEIGIDMLTKCGIIDMLYDTVVNADSIYDAMKYEESIEKGLTEIIKKLDKKGVIKDAVSKK